MIFYFKIWKGECLGKRICGEKIFTIYEIDLFIAPDEKICVLKPLARITRKKVQEIISILEMREIVEIFIEQHIIRRYICVLTPSWFIDEYCGKIDWNCPTFIANLKLEQIEQNLHRIDPSTLLIHCTFSEDFLRKHLDVFGVNWRKICEYQKLSEAFMEDYALQLDWEAVSVYQYFSVAFAVKFRDNISETNFIINSNFSPKKKQKIIRLISDD